MEVGCGWKEAGGREAAAWARRPQIPLVWLDTPARLRSPDLVCGVHPSTAGKDPHKYRVESEKRTRADEL